MSMPALQLPGTIMERLQACIGMPVTVYLMGVHGALMAEMPGTHPGPGLGPGFGPGFGPGPCPGPGFGSGPGRPVWPGVSSLDNVEAKRNLRGPCPDPGPPCPSPCPDMEMMTTVVQGVLAFAGTDYISVTVAMGKTMNDFREVEIPYNAIGMIICAGMPMM